MLGAIAAEAARRFGERPVVVGPDGTLTYAELDRHANELAAGLAPTVSPGDRVAIVLAPGGDWLIAAVALNRLGAVFGGISTALTPNERATLVKVMSPTLVLADPDLLDGLPLRTAVSTIPTGSRGRTLARPDAVPAEISIDRHDPVAVCFTSGTTGTPKAAYYSTVQLEAVQRIDLGPDAATTWDGGAPMLVSTQFAHVGMTLKFPWYLRTGSTLHVMKRWRADDALRLIARYEMPVLGAVAPQLALMMRSPLMDELDVSCVGAIIAGGAASAPSLVEEARRRFGAAYSIRYSSTESGGVGLATAFDAPDSEALHTVGRPRPGIEARIVDDRGSVIEPSRAGEVGELQIRSDAVMVGYLDDPKATDAAFADDRWLRTGDLASYDEAGCVALAGRRSEMFIRGGYNVFPAEIESVLVEHPGIGDVVVVGVPDDVMGEVGVAVVVTDQIDAAEVTDIDALREFCGDRLARHKLPERVVVVDEIPMTTALKYDRVAATRLALDADA